MATVDTLTATYPGYAGTGRIDELRASEYQHLDQTGQVYLDYAGAGIAARSQIDAHHRRLSTRLYSNPHSENPSSQAAGTAVESARRSVLAFFRADPEEYAVVFTPNATGACRLVGEAYRFGRRVPLVLTSDNHNSVNGIREYARRAGGAARYVPLRAPDLRVAESDLVDALEPRMSRRVPSAPRGLFAFPAQSNFSGVQHPLEWVELAHRYGYDVLLDAAAFVPTNRLDLAVVHPDFVCLSWYKVFGYPTGIGALVARREALARLRRPWFAGGTIRAVSVAGDWYEPMDDESAFEDGTLNFLSIPDVEFGLHWIESVGIDVIHARVEALTGWLLERLVALRHDNGQPLVRVYGPTTYERRGGTISFNFLHPDGDPVDERLVAVEAAAAGLSLRTGCFCNPGAGEGAFGITPWDLRRALFHNIRTIDEYVDVLKLSTGGAVRISFGLASTVADAERFVAFAAGTYRNRGSHDLVLAPRLRC